MKQYILKNDYQELTILNYGATIHKWITFKENRNIVISNKNLNDYLKPENGYFGATVGRYSNRINQGKFLINNKVYQLSKNQNGKHHLHGGLNSFFNKPFDLVKYTEKELILKYFSKDGEDGYPGNLTLFVTYTLSDNKLHIRYKATSDKDTIVNIINHAHFNLSNEDTILNHSLYMPVKEVLEINSDLIPTGSKLSVKNTSFDFNKETLIKDVIFNDDVLRYTKGLDHAFLFENESFVHLKYKNKNLIIKSTYPSVQVYSMNHNIYQPLLDRKFKQHLGIAFEMQYEPDAINHSNFSNVVLKKDAEYNHEIIYELFET